jgi:ubiquinone/menaquinone biosynthesis C-methylase UbiE
MCEPVKYPSRNKTHIINAIRARIPFGETNAIWRNLAGKGGSILDVGCGKGILMKRIVSAGRDFEFISGVDVFQPYIVSCKQERVYHEVLLCDCRNLPFKRQSFDLILCSHVIEHLEKEDGIRLLNDLETIAQRRIVIVTPTASYPEITIKDLVDCNPFQKHRSEWLPFEFKARGYRLMGQGLRIKAKSQQGVLWKHIRARRDQTKAKTIYSLIYRNLRGIPDFIVGPFVRHYVKYQT